MPAVVSALASADMSPALTNVPAVCRSSALVPWATIRPLPMTMISSAMTSISCSRCDDSSTVPPRLAYSRSRLRIQWMPAGSRPLAGSSRIRIFGIAQQGVGDAEALPHAERVVLDPALRLVRGQADELEHLVDS